MNPELWIGQKSISALCLFISGYMIGKAEKLKDDSSDWYTDFSRYISDRYSNRERHIGIAQAILSSGCNEQQGFDLFYVLMDEFILSMNSEKVEESPQKLLSTHETRVLRIGFDAINEILSHYISDHMSELFNLQSDSLFTDSFKV